VKSGPFFERITEAEVKRKDRKAKRERALREAREEMLWADSGDLYAWFKKQLPRKREGLEAERARMLSRMADSANDETKKLAEKRLQQIEKKLSDRSAKRLAWIALLIAAGSLAVAIIGLVRTGG